MKYVLSRMNVLHDLVQTQEEYIELLREELHEIVPLASVHGWKSSRADKGIELRERIDRAKNTLEGKDRNYSFSKGEENSW
jgi:hypothetical protein